MPVRRNAGEVQFLKGTFRRLLFSRTGHVSGIVLKLNRSTVSVMMEPREGAAMLPLVSLGKELLVLATQSPTPMGRGKSDTCYRFISLATPEGRPRAWPVGLMRR